MADFIPTEACALLSIIGRDTPNLLKYIVKFSAINPKKSAAVSLILLSAQQIIDARAHPTGFVKQGIMAAATVQSSLNTTAHQFDAFAKQFHQIESLLGNYLADKDKAKSTENNSIGELEKQLVEATKAEKELKTLLAQLNKQFDEVNKLLDKHAIEWDKHYEGNFKVVVEQLAAALGIVLTAEEKIALASGSETLSSIRDRRARLKQHQIEIDKESEFVAAIYDVVASFKSRNFDKVAGKSSVKEIVKELSGIIKQEAKAAEKLQATQAKECENIKNTAKQLANQALKFNALIAVQAQLIERAQIQQETLGREAHLTPEATN